MVAPTVRYHEVEDRSSAPQRDRRLGVPIGRLYRALAKLVAARRTAVSAGRRQLQPPVSLVTNSLKDRTSGIKFPLPTNQVINCLFDLSFFISCFLWLFCLNLYLLYL